MTCRGVCKCLCGVFDLTYCIHSLTLQHHIRSHSLSQSTHTPVAICHIDSLIALPARRKCPEGQQNHRSHIGSLRSHRSQRRGRKSGRGRRRSQNLEFAIWAERDRERESEREILTDKQADGQTGRQPHRQTRTKTDKHRQMQGSIDPGSGRGFFVLPDELTHQRGQRKQSKTTRCRTQARKVDHGQSRERSV